MKGAKRAYFFSSLAGATLLGFIFLVYPCLLAQHLPKYVVHTTDKVAARVRHRASKNLSSCSLLLSRKRWPATTGTSVFVRTALELLAVPFLLLGLAAVASFCHLFGLLAGLLACVWPRVWACVLGCFFHSSHTQSKDPAAPRTPRNQARMPRNASSTAAGCNFSRRGSPRGCLTNRSANINRAVVTIGGSDEINGSSSNRSSSLASTSECQGDAHGQLIMQQQEEEKLGLDEAAGPQAAEAERHRPESWQQLALTDIPQRGCNTQSDAGAHSGAGSSASCTRNPPSLSHLHLQGEQQLQGSVSPAAPVKRSPGMWGRGGSGHNRLQEGVRPAEVMSECHAGPVARVEAGEAGSSASFQSCVDSAATPRGLIAKAEEEERGRELEEQVERELAAAGVCVDAVAAAEAVRQERAEAESRRAREAAAAAARQAQAEAESQAAREVAAAAARQERAKADAQAVKEEAAAAAARQARVESEGQAAKVEAAAATADACVGSMGVLAARQARAEVESQAGTELAAAGGARFAGGSHVGEEAGAEGGAGPQCSSSGLSSPGWKEASRVGRHWSTSNLSFRGGHELSREGQGWSASNLSFPGCEVQWSASNLSFPGGHELSRSGQRLSEDGGADQKEGQGQGSEASQGLHEGRRGLQRHASSMTRAKVAELQAKIRFLEAVQSECSEAELQARGSELLARELSYMEVAAAHAFAETVQRENEELHCLAEHMAWEIAELQQRLEAEGAEQGQTCTPGLLPGPDSTKPTTKCFASKDCSSSGSSSSDTKGISSGAKGVRDGDKGTNAQGSSTCAVEGHARGVEKPSSRHPQRPGETSQQWTYYMNRQLADMHARMQQLQEELRMGNQKLEAARSVPTKFHLQDFTPTRDEEQSRMAMEMLDDDGSIGNADPASPESSMLPPVLFGLTEGLKEPLPQPGAAAVPLAQEQHAQPGAPAECRSSHEGLSQSQDAHAKSQEGQQIGASAEPRSPSTPCATPNPPALPASCSSTSWSSTFSEAAATATAAAVAAASQSPCWQSQQLQPFLEGQVCRSQQQQQPSLLQAQDHHPLQQQQQQPLEIQPQHQECVVATVTLDSNPSQQQSAPTRNTDPQQQKPTPATSNNISQQAATPEIGQQKRRSRISARYSIEESSPRLPPPPAGALMAVDCQRTYRAPSRYTPPECAGPRDCAHQSSNGVPASRHMATTFPASSSRIPMRPLDDDTSLQHQSRSPPMKQQQQQQQQQLLRRLSSRQQQRQQQQQQINHPLQHPSPRTAGLLSRPSRIPQPPTAQLQHPTHHNPLFQFSDSLGNFFQLPHPPQHTLHQLQHTLRQSHSPSSAKGYTFARDPKFARSATVFAPTTPASGVQGNPAAASSFLPSKRQCRQLI